MIIIYVAQKDSPSGPFLVSRYGASECSKRKVKEYYYSKLSNVKKFNLDYETFFLEFEDNLLNG